MLSRSQIDKLGERLKASAEVEPEDLTVLQTLRSEHDAAMLAVAQRLIDELDVEPGTRLKTVGTIVDKLRRESIRLSQMQDIAGVRLVADMSLEDQDQLVERVVALFPERRVVDRRANPSHGYRAVHVIVELDRRFVEVQVRTELQHAWAQVFEALADVFGREIRYGGSPVRKVGRLDASAIVDMWRSEADTFREVEEVAVDFAHDTSPSILARHEAIRDRLVAASRSMLEGLSSMRPLEP